MRFWRKKYYREVECKACGGHGAFKMTEKYFDRYSGKQIGEDNITIKACTNCNGKGTQTVLEREE